MATYFSNNTGIYTYYISGHGSTCSINKLGTEVPLPPNVLVVMNCKSSEIKTNLDNEVVIWNTIIQQSLQDAREIPIDKTFLLAFVKSLGVLNTIEENSFCIYKNKCPNLLLSFEERNAFVSGIYELPVRVIHCRQKKTEEYPTNNGNSTNAANVCQEVLLDKEHQLQLPTVKEVITSKQLQQRLENFVKKGVDEEKIQQLKEKIESCTDTTSNKCHMFIQPKNRKDGHFFKVESTADGTPITASVNTKINPNSPPNNFFNPDNALEKFPFVPFSYKKSNGSTATLYSLADVLNQSSFLKHTTTDEQKKKDGYRSDFYNKLHVFVVNACTNSKVDQNSSASQQDKIPIDAKDEEIGKFIDGVFNNMGIVQSGGKRKSKKNTFSTSKTTKKTPVKSKK